MDTIKNNKLIAEFMAIDKGQFEIKLEKFGWFDSRTEKNFSKFLYHSDWNWLMPVVEKIENLENHGFTIYRKTTNINGIPLEIANTRKSSKIEAVYNAVIYFINWYNENKQSTSY